jgi:hypothetical protein
MYSTGMLFISEGPENAQLFPVVHSIVAYPSTNERIDVRVNTRRRYDMQKSLHINMFEKMNSKGHKHPKIS